MNTSKAGTLPAKVYQAGLHLADLDLAEQGALASIISLAQRGGREVASTAVFVEGLGGLCPMPSPTLRTLRLGSPDFWGLSVATDDPSAMMGSYTLRAGGRDLFMVAVVLQGTSLRLDLGDVLVNRDGVWVPVEDEPRMVTA